MTPDDGALQEAGAPRDGEGVVGLYRRHARAWAAARDASARLPPIEAGWLDRFLALLPPRPAVLDLGCGTGDPIARYLARRGCAVTGIDASPELLAVARARVPGGTWLDGDMRSLDLGSTFDGIVAWDSFFHLCHDDQRRMFPLFRAHAAPGAALLFTSGTSHGTAMGTFGGEALYHASLDGDEYRALLAANGFAVAAHAVEDPACGRRTIWLARHA